MSIKLMSQVWSLKLSDSDKIVLLALADAANDEGGCWPSMATLAEKCSKSDRTVQAAVKSLVEAGHLSRDVRPGKGIWYTVHPQCPTPEAASGRSDCAPKPTTLTPEAASDKPKGTINSSKKATLSQNTRAWRDPYPRPDGVHETHWRDFLANRKRKRQPNTPSTHQDLLNDLARLSDDEWPPGRLFEHAARKGWANLYDPRQKDDGNAISSRNNRPADSLRGSRPDPSLDLLRAARRELAAEKAAGGDHEADRGAWLAVPSQRSS